MSEMNLQILLASRPSGLPTADNFKTTRVPIEEPGPGEVLVRGLMLSLDPAMRGWMNEGKSYIPPVELGAVMRAGGIGEVVRSCDPRFSPGDLVNGWLGWQRYARLPADNLHLVPKGTDIALALSALGATGLTAYFGLLDVGRPKPGETVLVSGAAGAVGSVAGQIARLRGCRAVGVAGSDDKCAWLTGELRFDAAINYRSAKDLHRAIREACPKGVDVFFDNVGGDVLDAALRCLAPRARVVISGAISQYNEAVPRGPKNYLSLLVNRARMEGFVVFDYADRYPEARAQLGAWLAQGELRGRTDIVDGLESAPAALCRLFDGSNTGKLLLSIG